MSRATNAQPGTDDGRAAARLPGALKRKLARAAPGGHDDGRPQLTPGSGRPAADRLDVSLDGRARPRSGTSSAVPRRNGSPPSSPAPESPTRMRSRRRARRRRAPAPRGTTRRRRRGSMERPAPGPRRASTRASSQAERSSASQRHVPAEVEVALVLGELEAVPLEQDGEVGRLLDLDHQDPRADRVRRARGHEDGVARDHRQLAHRAQHGLGVLARSSSSRTSSSSTSRVKPTWTGGAGVGLDDQPRLGLAVGEAELARRELAVGMEVHRAGAARRRAA